MSLLDMPRTDEEMPLLPGRAAEGDQRSSEPHNLPTLGEVLAECPIKDTGATLERYLAAHGIQRLGALHTNDPSIRQWFNAPGTIQTCASSSLSDWADAWRRKLGCPSLLPANEDCMDEMQHPGRVRSSSQLWTLVYQCVVGNKLRTALSHQESSASISMPAYEPQYELEAYVVALRYPAAPQGVLQAMVRRLQAGGCSAAVFTMPALQALVHYKWSSFARHLLIGQLLCYLGWLGSFMGFMLLYNTEDALRPNPQVVETWQGLLSVVLEVLALLSMLPFVALDLVSVLTYGRGWVSTYNLLDVATYMLQVLITALHLGQYASGRELLPMAVAAQCILLWVRLQFFSRLFRSTQFDFVDSMMAVLRETSWYLAIMTILMFAYACAFYTVFKDDNKASFDSLPLSMLTMLNFAIGGTSYYMRDLLESEHPGTAIVLCIIYHFTVSMVVMRLLTGVMTNALLKVTQDEGMQLLASRAQTVDEMEMAVPKPLRLVYKGQWNPRYVHVLRLSASSAASTAPQQAADYGKLWEKAEPALTNSSRAMLGDPASRRFRTGTDSSTHGGLQEGSDNASSHARSDAKGVGISAMQEPGVRSTELHSAAGRVPDGMGLGESSPLASRHHASVGATADGRDVGHIREEVHRAGTEGQPHAMPDPHDPQLREQVSRLEAKLEQALALLQEMACRTLTPAGS